MLKLKRDARFSAGFRSLKVRLVVQHPGTPDLVMNEGELAADLLGCGGVLNACRHRFDRSC